MMRWFRYVPFSRIADAIALGMLPTPALVGTHHGEYACLCEWRCCCGREMPA